MNIQSSSLKPSPYALEQERSFLKSLIQNLPDLIWMKDAAGVYLACNSEFEKFFGAKEEAILGKTDYDFVDKELADFFRKHDKKAMAKGSPSVNEEWIVYASDGHKALLETTKTPILNEQNEVIGVLGIGHDITKRKEQEEAIRESEERLKEAQRLSKIGNWELDLITGQLYWSEEVYHIFELNPALFSSSYESFLDAIHPDDRELVNVAYQQSLDEREPYNISHRLLINGQVKYVEEQGETDYSEEGIPLRSMGTIQDVTQRMLYEIQLNRLKRFIDYSPDGLFIVEANTSKIIDVNQSACTNLGYSKEEMLKLHVWDLSNTILCEADWQERLPNFIRHQGLPFEEWHRHRDGHLIPIEVIALYIEEPDGQFFVTTTRDITERKKVEAAMHESSQRYDAVLASTTDGFWVINSHSCEIVEVNETYCLMSGYSRDELIGKKAWELDVNFCEDKLRGFEEQNISQNGAIFETAHRHKDGSTWPLEVSVSYSGLQGGRLFAFLRDISERKQIENKIQHMAYHDVLTGLPNRELLSDRLHQAILLAQRTGALLAICYLDLDGFKPINDRFGHQTGDELLIKLSHRLSEHLRESDTLARIGGDEFVVLLTDLNTIYQGEDIIQRMLEGIVQPFDIDHNRIHISASIGVTVFPHDNSDPDTLLRHADQAMYAAKENGKNVYTLFDPIQNHKVHAYRQAINEFGQALTDSQLVLYYQPRIDLRSGELVSVEALVRWQHPARGLLAPGKFLPMIEGSALEIALDEWVLKAALDQHMAWREQGMTIPVSVNISPRHIKQTTFPSYLQKLLSNYPSDIASSVELEVLETSTVGNTSQVAKVMKACTDLGVRFSLDDFGTGYSSLTYFHRLPISMLKIDQDFVRDMLDNPQDQDIVEGVLRLAEALKRPVVAEGVESIELGLMLLQLGCQYAQGYGIAKPMPPEALEGWHNKFKNKSPWSRLTTDIQGMNGPYDLNVAIFTVRSWVEKIKIYLQSGLNKKCPHLDGETCQFSCWYKGIGVFRYGEHPLYPEVQTVHLNLHTLAEEIIQMADNGHLEQALSRFDELDVQCVKLISLLCSLTDSSI